MIFEDRLRGVKVVFFDIDGTLVIPRFKFGDMYRLGVAEDVWDRLTVGSLSNPYNTCKAPACMKEFLSYLASLGVETRCLTVEYNSKAYFYKADFVLQSYPDFFKSYKDIDFVYDSSKKVDFMKNYAKARNLLPSEILLVDDLYGTTIDAQNNGFRAILTSEFLEWGD